MRIVVSDSERVIELCPADTFDADGELFPFFEFSLAHSRLDRKSTRLNSSHT